MSRNGPPFDVNADTVVTIAESIREGSPNMVRRVHQDEG